jgi:hypothetical protein
LKRRHRASSALLDAMLSFSGVLVEVPLGSGAGVISEECKVTVVRAKDISSTQDKLAT